MARPNWMLGYTIRDATRADEADLWVRGQDLVDADALNGHTCVATRATCRALGAPFAYYYRSKAYVVWPDSDVMVRYQVSDSMRKHVIEVLDDPLRPNSEIRLGRYRLLAIPPKQRLGLNRSAKPGSEPRGPKADRGHRPRAYGRIDAAFNWVGDRPVGPESA